MISKYFLIVENVNECLASFWVKHFKS